MCRERLQLDVVEAEIGRNECMVLKVSKWFWKKLYKDKLPDCSFVHLRMENYSIGVGWELEKDKQKTLYYSPMSNKHSIKLGGKRLVLESIKLNTHPMSNNTQLLESIKELLENKLKQTSSV